MAKVRKLTSTCLSLLVFALSENLNAIGLGEIHLYSHLNEPLLAEISIEDVQSFDTTDVVVKAGDSKDFEKMGLEPPLWLSAVEFVVTQSRSSRQPVISLTTQESIKDPYTNLVVSISWPNGKLIKEYTILLDPPPLNTKLPMSAKLTLTNPLENPSKKKPVLAGEGTDKIALSGAYGPVYQETLWSIAKKLVKATPYSTPQGVMAIAYKNPEAFAQNNIHAIKKGAILQLPTHDEIGQFSQQEAQRFILSASKQQGIALDYPLENSPQPLFLENERLTQEDRDKRLKLIAPLAQQNASYSRSADATNQALMAQRLTMIEEAIDTLKRSNEDISQKNQSLLQQNESLAAQLVQKDQEINQLKQAMQARQISQIQPALPASSSGQAENYAIAKSVIQSPGIKEEKNERDRVGAGSANSTNTAAAATLEAKMPSPTVAPTVVSARAPSITADRSSSSIFLWLFGLAVIGWLLGWLWLCRERLLGLLNARQKNSVLQNKANFMARGENASSEDLNFNLDKALAAVIEEEKRFLLPQPLIKQEESAENLQELQGGLEEVELYIAYERYAEAEKCLKDLLKLYPQSGEVCLKLLEIYVLTQRYEDFKQSFSLVSENIKERAPQIWSKIHHLYEKVKNEKVLDLKTNTLEEKNPAIVMSANTFQKSSLSFKDSPITSEGFQLIEPDNKENADCESQLSLAQAFIEISDLDAARELLIEVAASGTLEQIKQAELLLDRIGKFL